MEQLSDAEIGGKLKRLRGIRTMSGLAQELGIPVSTYQSYEYGARHVPDAVKIKIAKYYGLSVSEIFFAGE